MKINNILLNIEVSSKNNFDAFLNVYKYVLNRLNLKYTMRTCIGIIIIRFILYYNYLNIYQF